MVLAMSERSIKAYLASLGKKGGEAGTGKSKVRGSAEYYKRISAEAAKARKAKQQKRGEKSSKTP